MTADARFMRRALELAERGRGLTSPNPMVGAVVVRDGEVVAEAFHRAAGQAHAEVEALRLAGVRARGATLYVTLEPCAHHGRTPPCAPVVAASGLRRVVVALGDPNPLVAGRGLDALRQAGIETVTGVLRPEAERQNRVFLTAVRRGRPHVTLKVGMSLDGKIADTHGVSRWITGEAARLEGHRLRSEADAVVVGVGTVLADDPELTVRLPGGWPREPWRVVLDTQARTPPAARVIAGATAARALVAVGEGARPDRVEQLRAAGATVVACRTCHGRVDLVDLLGRLATREVRGVLVEGGGEVHGSFLEAGLVDRAMVFVAPLLLGGRTAPPAVGGAGLRLTSAVRLEALTVRPVADDLLLEGDVRREV